MSTWKGNNRTSGVVPSTASPCSTTYHSEQLDDGRDETGQVVQTYCGSGREVHRAQVRYGERASSKATSARGTTCVVILDFVDPRPERGRRRNRAKGGVRQQLHQRRKWRSSPKRGTGRLSGGSAQRYVPTVTQSLFFVFLVALVPAKYVVSPRTRLVCVGYVTLSSILLYSCVLFFICSLWASARFRPCPILYILCPSICLCRA